MRNIILLLLALLIFSQTSCENVSKPSILVIAADRLTFSDINCANEDSERSGFQTLCNESVRFSHAFTTSTLSVPAIASILTGLYPHQHGVRHNGEPGLAAEVETVAEGALREKNFRTAFFSGGPSVFRKSGLNQGFEVFDDNLVPSLLSIHRPFKKTSEAFLDWLENDVKKEPFLSFLYAPDLAFTTKVTSTEMGETRNLSFESQLDEMNESLHDLIQTLKKRNRWNNTLVILVGLNGRGTQTRSQELNALNVHGENTQVVLFIKPAISQKRDQNINWKIDQNVSLADLGRTISDFLNLPDTKASDVSFPTQSLLTVLKIPTPNWATDRPLLIESGWALWRKAGPVKTAIISDYVLLINEETPKIYSTLVDRFEVNPLPPLQESILPTTKRIQSLIEKNNFVPFKPIQREWITKQSISYSRWMKPDEERTLLRDLKLLIENQPQSLDLIHWAAQISLNLKDWASLLKLGQKNKVSLWQYVAERNIRPSKPIQVFDTCLALLSSPTIESEHVKNCSDPLFLELVDWLRSETRGLNKEVQRKRFERSFTNYRVDQLIERTNIALGLIWDTSKENIFTPSRAELALSLPEYARQRNSLYKGSSDESSP